MMKCATPIVFLLLACACVFTAGACGGSAGSSSGGSPELFSGNYFIVGFSGESAATDVGTGFWGSLTSDGAGEIIGGTLSRNDNSVVSGPGPITPFSYSVGAGARMIWTVTGLPSFEGGVTADGRTAMVASRTPLLSPQAFLLSKRAGAFSAASLSGRYHLAAFFYNSTTAEDGAIWGAVDFDGIDMGTFDVTTNTAGVIVGPTAGVTPYAVAADGTVTYRLSTAPLEGGVLLGGNLIVLGGQTSSGGVQILVVLIKVGAGLDTSTFGGTYHAVGLFADDAATPEWRATTAVATADGTGTLSIAAGTANEDAVIVASPPAVSSYTVAPDGVLMVTGGGGLFGGVSSDGNHAAFAGGAGAGDDPEMWVLFR